ncbi:hypothetical protein RRG08_050201 [Elysia crispata]|uniref:Uncharacterized protein n=1 Tax=Elysia crispata TaxID=231223 RepID=A0AAE0Z6S8_9GAST|nr:hypothetical protein RRG08_050201 [Elysia crispata]
MGFLFGLSQAFQLANFLFLLQQPALPILRLIYIEIMVTTSPCEECAHLSPTRHLEALEIPKTDNFIDSFRLLQARDMR